MVKMYIKNMLLAFVEKKMCSGQLDYLDIV